MLRQRRVIKVDPGMIPRNSTELAEADPIEMDRNGLGHLGETKRKTCAFI